MPFLRRPTSRSRGQVDPYVLLVAEGRAHPKMETGLSETPYRSNRVSFCQFSLPTPRRMVSLGVDGIVPSVQELSMPDAGSLPLFDCPTCQAVYRVVEAEAGPETIDRDAPCRRCGGFLPVGEGNTSSNTFT